MGLFKKRKERKEAERIKKSFHSFHSIVSDEFLKDWGPVKHQKARENWPKVHEAAASKMALNYQKELQMKLFTGDEWESADFNKPLPFPIGCSMEGGDFHSLRPVDDHGVTSWVPVCGAEVEDLDTTEGTWEDIDCKACREHAPEVSSAHYARHELDEDEEDTVLKDILHDMQNLKSEKMKSGDWIGYQTPKPSHLHQAQVPLWASSGFSSSSPIVGDIVIDWKDAT